MIRCIQQVGVILGWVILSTPQILCHSNSLIYPNRVGCLGRWHSRMTSFRHLYNALVLEFFHELHCHQIAADLNPQITSTQWSIWRLEAWVKSKVQFKSRNSGQRCWRPQFLWSSVVFHALCIMQIYWVWWWKHSWAKPSKHSHQLLDLWFVSSFTTHGCNCKCCGITKIVYIPLCVFVICF